jgi:hypothetical protein
MIKGGNWLSYIFFSAAFFSQGTLQAHAESVANTYTLTTLPEGNAVNINWSTSAETNSDYFIIQRSQDGVIFDDVMQEIAAGNSSVVSSYSITDYRPYSGTSFYRVIEVDVDGNFSHTEITIAKFQMELSLTVNPGTSGTTFNVSIAGKEQKQVLLVVRDIQGKEYYSKVIVLRSVDEIVVVDPQDKLPPGLYTVVASSSNAMYSKKIMITE